MNKLEYYADQVNQAKARGCNVIAMERTEVEALLAVAKEAIAICAKCERRSRRCKSTCLALPLSIATEPLLERVP